jgi:hypothetical protein
MKNNFLSKVLLFFIMVQSGMVIYQLYKLDIKTRYITSRSNELKIENDKWFNFVTNSLFFSNDKWKERLFYALSEIDFKVDRIQNFAMESYKFNKYLNPKILSLLSSEYIVQNNSGWLFPRYYVFKDFYTHQYFIGNDTYIYGPFESQYYERYELTINGEKLSWNENHLYTIPKADNLNIKINRIFLDFESGNLMSDEVRRVIKM